MWVIRHTPADASPAARGADISLWTDCRNRNVCWHTAILIAPTLSDHCTPLRPFLCLVVSCRSLQTQRPLRRSRKHSSVLLRTQYSVIPCYARAGRLSAMALLASGSGDLWQTSLVAPSCSAHSSDRTWKCVHVCRTGSSRTRRLSLPAGTRVTLATSRRRRIVTGCQVRLIWRRLHELRCKLLARGINAEPITNGGLFPTEPAAFCPREWATHYARPWDA